MILSGTLGSRTGDAAGALIVGQLDAGYWGGGNDCCKKMGLAAGAGFVGKGGAGGHCRVDGGHAGAGHTAGGGHVGAVAGGHAGAGAGHVAAGAGHAGAGAGHAGAAAGHAGAGGQTTAVAEHAATGVEHAAGITFRGVDWILAPRGSGDGARGDCPVVGRCMQAVVDFRRDW